MCIIGLPESVSNAQLTDLCSKIIPEQLGLCIPCTIEHTHRIGENPGTNPVLSLSDTSTMLIKMPLCRNFTARVLYPLMRKLLLFADYSVEVMTRRKAFSAICSTLYTNQVEFTLAYSAVLCIQSHTGDHLTFTSLDGAEHYINNSSEMEMEHINSADGSSSKSAIASSALPRHHDSPNKPPYEHSPFSPQDVHPGIR